MLGLHTISCLSSGSCLRNGGCFPRSAFLLSHPRVGTLSYFQCRHVQRRCHFLTLHPLTMVLDIRSRRPCPPGLTVQWTIGWDILQEEADMKSDAGCTSIGGLVVPLRRRGATWHWTSLCIDAITRCRGVRFSGLRGSRMSDSVDEAFKKTNLFDLSHFGREIQAATRTPNHLPTSAIP